MTFVRDWYLFTGLIYFIWILLFLYGWIRIPLFKSNGSPVKTKVTVVIAARNEDKNIRSCLRDIQQQDFPKDLLEVVVADDDSGDETVNVIRDFQRSEKLK